SVWLGSMTFFSFAVAPSAFAVLPTRELAGALVTSTINKLELLGLIVGPLLMLINAASWRSKRLTNRSKLIQCLLLIVMIAAAALLDFWITPGMVPLRGAMGGHIDNLPISDPLRMRFNDLHQYSVALMGAAMIAGIVVLLLTVRSWIKR